MIKVVPLKFDSMFKKIFGQKKIFCEFVKDVLGIELKIKKVTQDYQYKETIGKVNVKYDLFAEDEEQRIIVEMQNVKETDFYDRFLYYHSLALIEQVPDSWSYRYDRTVYTIAILSSIPRDKSVDFSVGTMDMSILTENDERKLVYPHKLIFLNPRLINKKTPKGVRAWLELIEDFLDGKMADKMKKSRFKNIVQQIEKSKLDPDELAILKDEQVWETSKQISFNEGLETGLEQAKLEIARNMIKEGVDVEVISKVSGLSQKKILRIDITH